MSKVLTGNNSEDAKKDYFISKVKDGVIDEYGDRYELLQNGDERQVFPAFCGLYV